MQSCGKLPLPVSLVGSPGSYFPGRDRAHLPPPVRGCPRLRNRLRREGCSLFYTEALLGFSSFTSGFKPGLSLPAAPLPSPPRGIPRTVQREGAGPARRCGAHTSPRPGRPRPLPWGDICLSRGRSPSSPRPQPTGRCLPPGWGR